MFVTAIIAAGGRGARFGAVQPKQLLSVAGRPVLDRAVAAFRHHPAIDEVIVALPADIAEDPPPYLTAGPKPPRLVAGGVRRQDSVAAAFRAASPRADILVVHDAARPFVSADLISRTLAAAVEGGAALAAVPARDTVKQAEAGLVRATLDRSTIYLAQTPQAFRRAILAEALATDRTATDEASLVEAIGYPVRIVEGDATNIKITTPDDLPMAESIAAGQAPPAEFRSGTGYDLHRLVEGRPLVLGGVTVPFDRGLAGHSDGDAVCHAITDAILGAAALGDIGRHFPDTEARWQGASSIALLRAVVDLVRRRGLSVVNVDATVIAERPKLLPYVEQMRAAVGDAIGVAVDRVSIKGKTNEGVDALGRGEAIAVHAVATVRATRELS